MKKSNCITAALCAFAIGYMPLSAIEPQKDYSHIRGVCHGPTRDQAQLEKELDYAKRLNLNSTRIWLSYQAYQRDPKAYLENLKNYVRTSYDKFGITTMPILFNGNMMDPAILEPDFRKQGEEYVDAVIAALKDEPGLLMWDIMNEPMCNDYIGQASKEERPGREKKLWDFVRHYCKYVKKQDPKNATTVGVMYPRYLEHVADVVDVLSFHDYLETRDRVQHSYDVAKEISKKNGNKPLINSEMGCIARSNPYDMALEICEKNGAGFYLFNLIAGGYWGDIHGLVYPDGTVRDPAIVSALMGFYPNRDADTRVRYNPNKEGYVNRALADLRNAMTDKVSVFSARRASTDNLLEAMEVCANLLEGAQMVPMDDMPSARILAWKAQPDKERDIHAIRAYAYELAKILEEKCQIF